MAAGRARTPDSPSNAATQARLSRATTAPRPSRPGTRSITIWDSSTAPSKSQASSTSGRKRLTATSTAATRPAAVCTCSCAAKSRTEDAAATPAANAGAALPIKGLLINARRPSKSAPRSATGSLTPSSGRAMPAIQAFLPSLHRFGTHRRSQVGTVNAGSYHVCSKH